MLRLRMSTEDITNPHQSNIAFKMTIAVVEKPEMVNIKQDHAIIDHLFDGLFASLLQLVLKHTAIP
ncbi:Uncharacterised protein [Vibrio cholerae]|nr:Uncharacterised protein [Vibrio cholerae]CSA54063.1 Uncharacterised protein [Vibrio cholerae]CSD32138.1 Uncharacterised protein [Vibrio cholerae]